jgi:hypothetical protein
MRLLHQCRRGTQIVGCSRESTALLGKKRVTKNVELFLFSPFDAILNARRCDHPFGVFGAP